MNLQFYKLDAIFYSNRLSLSYAVAQYVVEHERVEDSLWAEHKKIHVTMLIGVMLYSS